MLLLLILLKNWHWKIIGDLVQNYLNITMEYIYTTVTWMDECMEDKEVETWNLDETKRTDKR